MKRIDVEDRVRRIAWPEPPAALRKRVLSTARFAGAPVTWADRVWYSRRWRLATAAAIVSAIALASMPGSDVPRFTPLTNAPVSQAIDEIGNELGLPSDLTFTLARRAVVADSNHPMRDRIDVALAIAETGRDRR